MLVILTGTVGFAALAGAEPLSFRSLEDTGLIPTDLSADGLTVVGNAGIDSVVQAAIWTADGGLVGLGVPPGFDTSEARGVSADGSVVVGKCFADPMYEAFVWTSDSGIVALGDLPNGPHHSIADWVSADGSVVLGRGTTVDGAQYIRWTADSGMVGLGDLFGGAMIRDMSADASVMVGNLADEAVRWTADEGLTGLGYIVFGHWSIATASSADGSIIVGFGDSPWVGTNESEAFRWTADEGIVRLGFLPDRYSRDSQATAVSGNGSVVVGQSPGDGGPAMVWDEINGMRGLRALLVDAGLDMTGWAIVDPIAISWDGRTIVGRGAFQGQTRYWLITGYPAPGTGCNPADFNVDGMLDVEDISVFVVAFSGQASAADLDDNGLFDLADIVAFINAFEAGCP
ncbi:MAG: PEP-CTERM sorting domain-containing protein [Phycisphaeraceae bacterium]|nr:MAG: PEP-CTERM sorting domain-containing protein [Phycisphaeraceae bacterium]